MPSKKASLFIDGFNLYHSLTRPHFRKYKWLNLRGLGQQFITSTETLNHVYYFTAYSWNPDKKRRHQLYAKLNEALGCRVILGRFQEKERTSFCLCDKLCIAPNNPKSKTPCGKKFIGHEEKLTDVNIAVNILQTCIKGESDSIYLLSGDNDLIPALEIARELCPSIKIRIILPIDAKAKNLIAVCKKHDYKYMSISEKHLNKALFPDVVQIAGVTYVKPPMWA